jgi:hypothetical protein
MVFRIAFYSLFAKTFVINLIEEFKRDIGLKSFTLLGLSILGIIVI